MGNNYKNTGSDDECESGENRRKKRFLFNYGPSPILLN